MSVLATTYGLGGFDADHPNGNVVEELIDNGNGTGTRTRYDDAGQVLDVEHVEVPAPPAPAPTVEERLAAVEAKVDALDTKADVVVVVEP